MVLQTNVKDKLFYHKILCLLEVAFSYFSISHRQWTVTRVCVLLASCWLSNRSMIPGWLNTGPTSKMMAQYWGNQGSAPLAWWSMPVLWGLLLSPIAGERAICQDLWLCDKSYEAPCLEGFTPNILTPSLPNARHYSTLSYYYILDVLTALTNF